MLAALPKATFSMLAGSPTLKRLASRYGMQRTSSFARRFIAGENVADAIDAARAIERSGLFVTLDLLGESVRSVEDAARATRAYVEIDRRSRAIRHRSQPVRQTHTARPRRRSRDLHRQPAARPRCRDAGRLLRPHRHGRLRVYGPHARRLRDGVEHRLPQRRRRRCSRALKRSARDVQRLMQLGARVRLVKGAYREPRDVAFQQKAEVDASFIELMQVLLRDGTYPAIATHDPGDDRGDEGIRRRIGTRAGPVRVPDALRHPPRSAGRSQRRRASLPRLRAVRHANGSRISCDGSANGPPTSAS